MHFLYFVADIFLLVAWWFNGLTIRRSLFISFSGNNLRQVVHMRASIIMQYNLV